MVEFEYINISGDYFHENLDPNYIILEYRLKVYDGIWKFDNGLIMNEKFNFYSQRLNFSENLKHQNITIKMLSKIGKATLIVKKTFNKGGAGGGRP